VAQFLKHAQQTSSAVGHASVLSLAKHASKKQGQVSTLHSAHEKTMMIAGWGILFKVDSLGMGKTKG
jgi:hypothetical protein